MYPHGLARAFVCSHTSGINEGLSIFQQNLCFQGIIARDQIVFEHARGRNIPIMMVTSGGYQRTTARIIADSIKNLKTLKLISCDEAENAPSPEPGGLHKLL